MLLQKLDSFIGPSLANQQDTLYKSRLLVGALFTFIASVLGFFPFFVLVDGLPDNAIIAYSVIATPLVACWLIILSFLRRGKAYDTAAHTVILSLNLVLFTGIAVTGGPYGSEVHPLLITPVLLGFLLLRTTPGLLWAGATLAGYLLMVFLQVQGVQYADMAPEDARHQLRVFNFCYAFAMCTALVFIYDTINRSVTQERDAERQRLEQLAHMAINSGVINDSASHLQTTGEELLTASIEQKTAIEQLATTAEELGATAEQNSHQAGEALSAITATDQQIQQSQNDIDGLITAIGEVKQLSNDIQSINNIINDIAYQTNLLSLNAMIEASRTSDNGGFKVVALEVKKLAERSGEAASGINALLSQNVQKVQQSVDHATIIHQCFDQIAGRIQPLIFAVQNIADASFEQNEALRQINAGLTEIDRAISVSRKLADHASETAKALKDNADHLSHEMQSL